MSKGIRATINNPANFKEVRNKKPFRKAKVANTKQEIKNAAQLEERPFNSLHIITARPQGWDFSDYKREMKLQNKALRRYIQRGSFQHKKYHK